MADISHHQFITLLKRSKVVEPKKIQAWFEKNKKIQSARKLAKSLVNEELLTTWQAKFLLSGRHRLRIGNYFLLSRLRRDELGARYLAVHASLKRKVELQIFARDLTSDTQRWKEMIHKASFVAKLDHPALVHVYDIDHDDDRYFLVVEHVAGRPLDVQKEIFTTPQIGKLVLQCAEGIEVAHQNQVVHGTIDQADILLTEKGTVKLQNLTVSPMRNLNSEAPEAEPAADYVAMAVLGEKILQANPGADVGAGVGLSAIFELMKSNGPKAIVKLKKWVEATPDPAGTGAQVTKSGANPIFSPTAESSSGVDLSKTSNASSVGVGEGDDAAAATSSTSIIEAARSSRPFLIAIAIGALMFCGIVIFGIVRSYDKFVGEPARQAVVEKEDLAAKKKAAYSAKEQRAFEARQAKKKSPDNESDIAKPNGRKARRMAAARRKKEQQKDGEKAEDQQPNEDAASSIDSDVASPNEAMPSEAGQEDSELVDVEPNDTEIDTAEPAAEPSKYANLFAKPSTETSANPGEKTTAGAADSADKGVVPAATMDPDNLRKLPGIGPATDRVLRKQGVTTFEQIIKMTPEELDSVIEEGGGQKLGKGWEKAIAEAKPLAEISISNSKNPFRKVPELFDLPAIDSSESKKLTELLIPANYALTTELISHEGVSPRQIFFELNKSSGDGVWTVAVKKSKTASQSTDIATFTKTFDALNFAWLPAAAKDKSAVYLRNCLLRLSTPDGNSSISKLRKPLAVRALRINEDKLTDSFKFEIEGAPNLDDIKIQVAGFANRSIEILEPTSSFDSPAVVALRRRDTKKFITLQVFAERSGKLIKLSVGLVFNGSIIKSKKQLVAIENQLAGIVANAQRRLQADPENKKLPGEVRATEATLDQMKNYLMTLKWFFEGGGGIGQPINFDVSAEFADGRLQLVKSDKNLVDDNKKKK